MQVRRRQKHRTFCFQIGGQSSEVSCSRSGKRINSNISSAHIPFFFFKKNTSSDYLVTKDSIVMSVGALSFKWFYLNKHII